MNDSSVTGEIYRDSGHIYKVLCELFLFYILSDLVDFPQNWSRIVL